MPNLGVCQACIAKVFITKEVFSFQETLLSESLNPSVLGLLAVKGQLPNSALSRPFI
jgi:hypothetical protein